MHHAVSMDVWGNQVAKSLPWMKTPVTHECCVESEMMTRRGLLQRHEAGKHMRKFDAYGMRELASTATLRHPSCPSLLLGAH